MEDFLCAQCPRRCGAPRGSVGSGFCKMGANPVVSRIALHFDEEPCISGTRGSGTVFFSGCALRCVFCQNEKISHGGFGRTITPEQLSAGFQSLIDQGAHNINLVNPTHFLHVLDRILPENPRVPVIFNTGGYERPETLRKFEGRVRVFLPDLKYIDRESAARYAKAPDYFDYAAPSLLEMLRQSPCVRLDDDGVIQSGVVVRHLILPGHAEESMRILDWIAAHMKGAYVSLMAQYMPYALVKTQAPELDRRLTRKEYERVVDHLMYLGLEDGYVQELSAADERYIPAFDLTGVESAETP